MVIPSREESYMFEADFGNRNWRIIRFTVIGCAALLMGWHFLVG
jgi:hypothetical protein